MVRHQAVAEQQGLNQSWTKTTADVLVHCNSFNILGRGQVVRHQVLVLAFGGSNPSALAKFLKSIFMTERITENIETAKERQAAELQALLDIYKAERVVVLGGTCAGKSTLAGHLDGAQDMDKLVFPLLTQSEKDYVCQTPWTPEIGETMTRLTKERVKVEAGKPVLGTVVLDADRIVYLKVSDELLHERTSKREVSFEDAKSMQAHIEDEIATSGLPVTDFSVG